MKDEADDRGRDATRPAEVPALGWRDVLWRTYAELTADHVSVVSAGVAFFGLLALFPAAAALIAIAGLLLDPATIQSQIAGLAGTLPEGAASIIEEQVAAVAASDGAGGLMAVVGVLLALYSASKGMKTLMEGMNIAYDEEEGRGFVRLAAVAIALTLFLIAGLLIALAALVALPALLGNLGLSDGAQTLVSLIRWPILAVLTILGLAVLYRYGPSRADPEWKWVSVGSGAAAVLWIVGSVAFSVYVRNFGTYNETYGTLGGVIILLTWLWLSAYIVLLGAEVNSELEHQTRADTTTGDPEPMGRRGAEKADSVGKTP